MKPTLLLVEDNTQLSQTIIHHLQSRFEITAVSRLDAAYTSIESQSFAVLVTDRLLPDGDGLEIIEYCRDVSPNTKIIGCSQLIKIEERLKGLSAGADDYLAKPFSLTELSLKLQNLIRYARIADHNTLTAGSLSLTLSTGELHHRSKLLCRLRKKETTLLAILMKNSNTTISKQYLLTEGWATDDTLPTLTTLDVYIRRIRMALQEHAAQLQTIRGFGYCLKTTP